MKNKKIFIICLYFSLAIFVFCSCKKNENYELVNQNNPETMTTSNNVVEDNKGEMEIPLNPEYNPLDEEDEGELIEDSNTSYSDSEIPLTGNNENNYQPTEIDLSSSSVADSSVADDEDMVYEDIKYAGATPIALVPVDLPTPTPRAPLKFNYQDYTAGSLNLKFQAPSGWEIDESQQNTIILNEPVANQKDNFSASLTIRAIPLTKEYTASDLNREMKSQLEQLGLLNYTNWSTSTIEKRPLLNANGLYANFKGTLATGVKIRGRLHMTAIKDVLYSVQIIHPASYNNDFIGVHTKVRKSLDFINK